MEVIMQNQRVEVPAVNGCTTYRKVYSMYLINPMEMTHA